MDFSNDTNLFHHLSVYLENTAVGSLRNGDLNLKGPLSFAKWLEMKLKKKKNNTRGLKWWGQQENPIHLQNFHFPLFSSRILLDTVIISKSVTRRLKWKKMYTLGLLNSWHLAELCSRIKLSISAWPWNQDSNRHRSSAANQLLFTLHSSESLKSPEGACICNTPESIPWGA